MIHSVRSFVVLHKKGFRLFDDHGRLLDVNRTPTIGMDFKLRTIQLDDKKIKIVLVDTAGQERFQIITTAHYPDAMGILVVYDVTNARSFANIKEWLMKIKKHAPQPVNTILIGRLCALSSLSLLCIK